MVHVARGGVEKNMQEKPAVATAALAHLFTANLACAHCVQATAAAQERQQLAEERADAEAAAKRAQQAQQLAQQRTLELEARVQVKRVGPELYVGGYSLA